MSEKKARKDDLIEFVKTDLHDKNISPHIIGNTEYYVRRAISNMQDLGILPPSELNFASIEKKEEHYDSKGNVLFNYYRMPEDFAEVQRFLVNNKEYYHYINDSHLLKQQVGRDNTPKFTVDALDMHVPEGTEGLLVLIAFPFPKDSDVISIRYITDGVNFNMSKLSSIYNEPLMFEVYKLLGIVPADASNEKAFDRVDRWQNPTSQRVDNSTITKTRPTLFGQARSSRQRSRMTLFKKIKS